MARIYTDLHRNILDVFNHYGVTIMTPAYEDDPERPKIVPEEQWYAEPARRSDTPPEAGARLSHLNEGVLLGLVNFAGRPRRSAKPSLRQQRRYCRAVSEPSLPTRETSRHGATSVTPSILLARRASLSSKVAKCPAGLLNAR
jgi:hypothetical protein